jgi:hypothetical protein
VFIGIGLTDIICRDGGSLDEAVARDAWLETVAELEQFGIENLDAAVVVRRPVTACRHVIVNGVRVRRCV